MPRALASELPAARRELFEDVAVADLGTHELDAALAQRELDRHVRHQRADRARHRQALRQAITDHQVQQLVTVVQAPRSVDQLQPVGIAIERDAVVGMVLFHRCDQRGGRGGAETGIDVLAVRAAADRDHVGAEFVEHAGRDVVGRAVGRIDDDLQALQRQLAAEGALAELDVAAARIFEFACLAEVGRGDPLRRLLEHRFDLTLPFVGQLLAARREKLDAVVSERVMRRTDHNSEVQAQRACHVGHAGCGQRPGQQHIDTGRREARFERGLDHVARDTRVLADQDRRLGIRRLQHTPDRVAEAQHEIGRDRRLADRAADAVGTKVSSAHVAVSSKGLIVTAPARRRATPSRHRPSPRHRAHERCGRHAGPQPMPRQRLPRGARSRPAVR